MPPDTGPGLGHLDAAGWALGALDPADAADFETHLQDCAECQTAVTRFEVVAHALRSPAPAVVPPPELEAKTLASVQHAVLAAKQGREAPTIRHTVLTARPQDAQTAANVQHAPPATQAEETAAPLPARMARWWHWHWHLPVFAAAVALGAAAAAAIVVLFPAGQAAAPMAAETNIPLHAATASSLTPGQLRPSGQANVLQTPEGWSIRLAVQNLPPLRPGEFYACWYAGPANRPGHPELIAAGTFTRNGSFTMWSAADPHKFRIMEITVDQADQPGQPGRAVLTGSPRRA